MVTLPSWHEPTPHLHREIAESFGADAERYDRARPHYPQELADTVLSGLAGRRVLDVGIGTGLSALPFRAAGAEVLGVEVDARMAELARSRGFEVQIARFEDWDSRGVRFDAVVSGQTWHWIDPVAGAAKAADVLRPGGRLALFWNVGEPEPAISAAFGEVYRAVDTGLPFTPFASQVSAVEGYERHIVTPAAVGIQDNGAFTTPQRLRLDWQTTITREAWLDQVPTAGGHNRIPAARLAELLEGLGKVIDDHGGGFTMNYATLALIVGRRNEDQL